jgi:hypothetical protein
MLPSISSLLGLCCTIASGQVTVLTFHNDLSRTGVNTSETVLTPSNVNSSSFGKLFVITTDGKVDAQPLYMSSVAMGAHGTHNVLYVATEHDSLYAFDADNGLTLWHASVLFPGETTSDNRGCALVVPEIGITATPVIAPQIGPHGTIFVVAMSMDSSRNYYQRLHALDISTGTEQFGGPVTIQAAYPGTGDNSINGNVVFDPKMYMERAALLFLNGEVYTMFASHCDHRPYTGWVIGYSASTLKQSGVLNLTPNGHEGAIWGSGAGAAADDLGNVYWLEANGTFDIKLTPSGFPSRGDYGNSFIKMSTQSNLQVTDYFTMFDTASESASDADLGSGGAILLPPLQDSQGVTRYLAVGAGKDQNIYVVDTNNMGKFNSTTNNVFQEIGGALNGQVFSTPAYFNGVLYYGASADHLKAFLFANGKFASIPSSQTVATFQYPGATPSISSNGSTNGIVWAAQNSRTAKLCAYDATDLSKELYDSNQAPNGRDHFGTGNKFIVPTIANGKVYVGTTSGVGVFGLLAKK